MPTRCALPVGAFQQAWRGTVRAGLEDDKSESIHALRSVVRGGPQSAGQCFGIEALVSHGSRNATSVPGSDVPKGLG